MYLCMQRVRAHVCVCAVQAVRERLSPSAAEGLDHSLHACAAGAPVHGADAGCCLSCHVSVNTPKTSPYKLT